MSNNKKQITPVGPAEWNDPVSRSRPNFAKRVRAGGDLFEGAALHFEKAKDEADRLYNKYAEGDAIEWRKYVNENPPDADTIGFLLSAYQSVKAKDRAASSHAETYSLQNEIIQYWRANVDIKMSAQKAADILRKQFPLSHRTLSKYVAAEKKLLHSN